MNSPKSSAAALAVLLFTACAAPSQPGGPEEGATVPQRATAPKRVTIAILADPKALGLVDTGPLPGRAELNQLLNSHLTVVDSQGVRRPQLAEEVPGVENGLWKVFPDGRMETTWRIRPGVEWHDGAPFTSQDFLFTTTVEQDREIAVRAHLGYNSVESVRAPDALTVTVAWKRIFLFADNMFAKGQGDFASPLPKHLLERPYLEDKGSFFSIPYWTEGYVGTGPFKLKAWAGGSHALLQANERYVPERPRIDEVEVKFIPDQNTLLANVLAGAVDLTIGRGISLQQASQVRGRWDGSVVISPGNPVVIFPKTATATPPVVADVRFRRALLHAIDRQQLVDTFLEGLSPIAHPVLRLSEADLREVQVAVVRYDHDPRKTAQLLEELGYVRGSDGLYAEPGRPRLSVELTTDTAADKPSIILAIADQWQQAGIGVDPVVIPPQAQRESSWQWTFPALSLRRNPIDLRNVELYFHSSEVPMVDNNFRGRNYMEYRSRDLDTLIERYEVSIPRQERVDLIRRMVQHITERAVILGIYYDAEVTLVGNRMRNVTGRSPDFDEVWNAHEWDLR